MSAAAKPTSGQYAAAKSPWLRLWADMANDGKFQTIARLTQQPAANIIAIYVHVLTNAGNAEERGTLHHFVSEDVATMLGLDTAQVDAVLAMMQGRLLDGDRVTGWAKRQPMREDGSAERAKTWRDAQKTNATITQTASAGATAKATVPTVPVVPPVVAVPAPAAAPVAVPVVVVCPAAEPAPAAPVVDAPSVEVAAVLTAMGVKPDPASPAIPTLMALGATTADFVDAAKIAKEKGKGFAYTVGIVRNKRANLYAENQPGAKPAGSPTSKFAPVAFNVTTPSAPGLDPTLAALIADSLIVRHGPSAEVRAKMAAMTRRPAAPVRSTKEEVCCA